MTDTPCPFCGSKTRLLETGTLSLKRSGKYEPDMSPCCLAQQRNLDYQRKRFGEDGSGSPDIDEISKL